MVNGFELSLRIPRRPAVARDRMELCALVAPAV
jgi:hypothetical protein